MFEAFLLFLGGIVAHWFGSRILGMRNLDVQVTKMVLFNLRMAELSYDSQELYNNSILDKSHIISNDELRQALIDSIDKANRAIKEEKDAFIRLTKMRVPLLYKDLFPFEDWDGAMRWCSQFNRKEN